MINRSSVFYNVLLLSVSGLLLQGMGFWYQVVLSRAAGAEALGIYRLVMPVYTVSIVTAVGVRVALTGIVSGMDKRAGQKGLNALLWRGIGSFLALFLPIAAIIMLLLRPIAVYAIGEPDTAVAIPVILICVFLSGFEGVFEALFLGMGRTKYAAASNLIEQVTKILLVLMFLAKSESESRAAVAVLIILGMALSEIPVIIWLIIVWRREVYGTQYPVGDVRYLKGRVLPIATPVALCSALTGVISGASTMLLPRRLELSGLSYQQAVEALGVIGEMALPLLLLPMVLVRSLSNILLPVISHSRAQQNAQDVKRKIEKSFQVTGLLVLPLTAILAPISGGLARLLYRQDLDALYTALLSIAAVLTYYEVVSGGILNGLGCQRMGTVYMIVGECMQLFFTLFAAAARNLGIHGYLLGMIVAPCVVLLLNLWLIQKKTGVIPDVVESYLIPLVIAGVTGGFTHFFYRAALAVMRSEWALLLAAVLGVLIAGACIVVSGVHPVKYLRRLKKTGA